MSTVQQRHKLVYEAAILAQNLYGLWASISESQDHNPIKKHIASLAHRANARYHRRKRAATRS